MAKYELTSEDITAITAAFNRLCEAVYVNDTLYSNMRRVSEILDSGPESESESEDEPGEGEAEGDA